MRRRFWNRRAFVGLLGGFAATSLAAWGQETRNMPRIGYLVLVNPEPVFGYFKEGLQKLGYVEGRNIQIELRSAHGNPERLPGLADELIRLRVDVLVAAFTPAMVAAKRATNQIPIVMAGAGDPVGTGLIASLARPGGNVTGTSSSAAELGGKVLETIQEVLPSIKRVAVMENVEDPLSKPFLEQIQAAGRKKRLEIVPAMIRSEGEIDAAFADLLKRRPDAVIVQPSLPRRRIADLASKHRLPSVAPNAAFPEEGGLMSYSSVTADVHRDTAIYVDKILRGAKPADLPVQQPTQFELVVNLRTARHLGLTVPKSVLARADRIIK